MATPDQVLAEARTEIRYTENPPGSNRNKFSAALGRPAEPWCADFIVAIARRVGLKLPSESASAVAMADGFHRAGTWHPGVAGAQAGDVVFFSFDGRGIEHVGWVLNPLSGSLATIEGNTSSGDGGSQANGGGVFQRVRPARYVVGYGRPPYTPTGVTPMFDPPLQIAASLECPTGGTWLFGQDGSVYAFGGAPYLGGANGKPYFANRKVAKANLVDGKYQIVATSGETYGPGF